MASAPAWHYVTTANHGCNADNATGLTVSCTASAGVTANDTVIVCAYEYAGTTPSTSVSVTDSINTPTTYTAVGTLYSASNIVIQMFYFKFTGAPASTTFTATFVGGTGSTINAMTVSEYSGLTPTLDATGTFYNYASASNVPSGSFTPGTIGDLAAACSFSGSSVTPGIGAGWVSRQSGVSNEYKVSEDNIVAGTGSQTAPFTNASNNSATAGAAFK